MKRLVFMGPGAHADAVQTKKIGEKALGAKLQHVGKGRGWGKKKRLSPKKIQNTGIFAK